MCVPHTPAFIGGNYVYYRCSHGKTSAELCSPSLTGATEERALLSKQMIVDDVLWDDDSMHSSDLKPLQLGDFVHACRLSGPF